MANAYEFLRTLRFVGERGQSLIEERVHRLIVLAEDLGVIGIGGHPLQTEKDDFPQAADVVCDFRFGQKPYRSALLDQTLASRGGDPGGCAGKGHRVR